VTAVGSLAVLLLSAVRAFSPGVVERTFVFGLVRDQDGPVAGATVRVQGTANATSSDAEGRFVLAGLTRGAPITVSAWAAGFYCAKVANVTPPEHGVVLTLRRYQTNDNPNYRWIAPTGEGSCASCKAAVTQVWLEADAHGKAAQNPRFLTMYRGTDVYGNQSPLTRYTVHRDYGRVPLPPDPTKPYYGPGYKLDFPMTSGNCATCHTPGAAIEEPYGTDPTLVSGADAFGVHCDFCHKVADVRVRLGGLPLPNVTGVLSMDIRRPFPEDPQRYQLFFGTFDDDNVPEEDTSLPLLGESRFCAPCHAASFWGVPIYDSYGEWLRSPYSDPDTGKTCQQCHMPAPTMLNGVALTNVAPGKGGIERDPMTIHAHTFPGAASRELLANAVTMRTTASLANDRLVVIVTVINDKTGHHVPSDSPLRHAILLVESMTEQGSPLTLLEGETVPAWGGEGDPRQGNYAGLPGKAFAKILQESWTGVTPTGAYWNLTRIVSDNRIAAFASDTSTYVFAAPNRGLARVRVTLLLRRAFKVLMDQKGWSDPDIVMAFDQFIVRRVAQHRVDR